MSLTRKCETIPRPCRFCSTSPICFLSHGFLKTFWKISFFQKIVLRAGKVQWIFMQLLLWTGGMIISFKPPETQFSIITRYALCIAPIQSLRLYLCNQTLFILWISATQSHPTSRSTCASINYPSPSFLWFYTFDRIPINALHAILIEQFPNFFGLGELCGTYILRVGCIFAPHRTHQNEHSLSVVDSYT